MLRRAMIVVFLFIAVTVFAGGIVTVKQTYAGEENVETSKMYVQDGMLRMEASDGADSHVMIFDSKKNLMYNIDNKTKKYAVISKEDFAKIGNTMNEAMKQMEEQLKQLPKEQQEMMKNMMKEKMPGMEPQEAPEKTDYIKEESGVTVGKWTCDRYVGKKDGQKVSEVWLTEWDDTGLKDEYKEAFDAMKSFFEDLIKQMGPMAEQMTDALDTWMIENGVPVKSVDYENGKVSSTSLVEDIQIKSLDSDLFTVPTGYTKQDMFGGTK